MSSPNPNYRPYYGSIISYSSQTPPYYSSTPTGNEIVPIVELDEFPTQVTLGAMSGGQGATPNAEDSTPVRRKNPKWSTDQNLVLISGWIKYGTDSVVGRNQKSDSYWGKIVDYYNEHCSFDPPRDGAACRNHYNYMNKILNKWTGVMITLNVCNKAGGRRMIQVGENIGSGSSGSKRVHESDASDSNTVGSSARQMGTDATKKREKELERLDKIAMRQEEASQLLKENTEAKKMKMFMKLSSKDHLDDRSNELLEKLEKDLFENYVLSS
ncbi:uncharacterized protein LOC131605551 [Vicia villosa]|uniref:uncharacterized protein LOC131605551 n=1 Tax=Vicia villosa TaxID=3911 RepID=UPI00273CF22D|nr:uncharacterized protein LOC131605551 [Vicia villosa]